MFIRCMFCFSPISVGQYNNDVVLNEGPHECERKCDGQTRTCRYHFYLEWYITMSKVSTIQYIWSCRYHFYLERYITMSKVSTIQYIWSCRYHFYSFWKGRYKTSLHKDGNWNVLYFGHCPHKFLHFQLQVQGNTVKTNPRINFQKQLSGNPDDRQKYYESHFFRHSFQIMLCLLIELCLWFFENFKARVTGAVQLRCGLSPRISCFHC